MKNVLLCIISLVCFTPLIGQVTFDNTIDQVTIDFDAMLSGVNNGVFDGAGLESMPSVGRLDGNAQGRSL